MLQLVKYPKRDYWPEICRRPEQDSAIMPRVRQILEAVKKGGDAALQRLTMEFDRVELRSQVLDLAACEIKVSPDLAAAIDMARCNIESFHRAQLREEQPVETQPGVVCWRRSIPIERVGLYIPGGTAPLFSSLLMLGIPARLAGCKEVVVCTPPQSNGSVHPAIIYVASILGLERIFLAGGAQAVAAMAFGTESIPRVDKIFGPGNAYVTSAKQLVQQQGVAIDMPAGPSEVLVIADSTSNPGYVAADLLSQAEHGPDSQVMLVTDAAQIIERVQEELESQLRLLPRAGIAQRALQQSKIVLVRDLEQAMALSNMYAPEHLIINTANAGQLAEHVVNAGSVFLGPYSCESAGDYCSGTNHTLPTNGFARCYSGVSVDSFLKQVTFQNVTLEGLRHIGPATERLAAAEQLQAHKNAVTIRLKDIEHV